MNIPEAAISKAASAMFAESAKGGVMTTHRYARAALEAAAPYMREADYSPTSTHSPSKEN
ncbi:hypothetical protein [Micrococcus sp. TA1]|uniref:hypothetical protein n=1 Tax=Micrococcus sp. TA1 TaxID=681627 RepID=UPI0016095B75|nr:hypothetical protein [Micrococcus sp. TA1]MBB5748551.1 hypothetical protein [Micrococcus sp. TA1]